MKRAWHVAGCMVVFAWCFICEAGLTPTGKHSGVLIFDRWGGCVLFKGRFLLYVSEQIKDRLQPFSGQCVDIDVTSLRRAPFGGDALITGFRSVVLSPEFRPQNQGQPMVSIHPDGEVERGPYWRKTAGLRLTSAVRIQSGGEPVGRLILENTNSTPIRLTSGDLALTLFRRGKTDWAGSDGPSYAIITRVGLESGRLRGAHLDAWTLDAETPLPSYSFKLGPGEKREFRIKFSLQDGQYDLVFGYGGQAHQIPVIASNLSAFDVDKGEAKAVQIQRR